LRALVKQALKVPEKPSAPSSYQLLGESAAIMQVRSMIERLSKSQAPVFITGESGSGKELAARMIHIGGARAEHPFVPGDRGVDVGDGDGDVVEPCDGHAGMVAHPAPAACPAALTSTRFKTYP
jgi:hypothetical protein